MSGKEESPFREGYADLIKEGLETVDEIEHTEELLRIDLNKGLGQRRLLTALCFIALISFTFFLYQHLKQSDEALSLLDANRIVLEDIAQTPRSPRARRAADAVASFVFSIDALARSDSLKDDAIERELTALRDTLRSTGEDSALLDLLTTSEFMNDGTLIVRQGPT